MAPLAQAGKLTFGPAPEDRKVHVEAPAGGVTVFLPRRQLVDAEEERKRLEKEIAKLDKDLELAQKKLANAEFVANAPVAVVEKERAKLADSTNRREVLMNNLRNL